MRCAFPGCTTNVSRAFRHCYNHRDVADASPRHPSFQLKREPVFGADKRLPGRVRERLRRLALKDGEETGVRSSLEEEDC